MQREKVIEKKSVKGWLAELSKAKPEEKNAGLWQYAYTLASKPRRQRVAVNLAKLEKLAKAGENIIVPGKLLGSGNVSKSLNITAIEYSAGAADKVRKAGGKILSLQEMMKKESVRIMV